MKKLENKVLWEQQNKNSNKIWKKLGNDQLLRGVFLLQTIEHQRWNCLMIFVKFNIDIRITMLIKLFK